MSLRSAALVHTPCTNASMPRRIGTCPVYQRVHAAPHWYTPHVPTRLRHAALEHTLCTTESTPVPQWYIVTAPRNLPVGPCVLGNVEQFPKLAHCAGDLALARIAEAEDEAGARRVARV